MKSILVQLNGTHDDRQVCAMALRVGRLFDAHLTCIHIVPDDRSLLRRALSVEMSAAMLVGDAVKSLRVQADGRTAFARDSFATFWTENAINPER